MGLRQMYYSKAIALSAVEELLDHQAALLPVHSVPGADAADTFPNT